jgi:hypothetical protein
MRRLLYRLPFVGPPEPNTAASIMDTLLELFSLWR